MAPTNCIQSRSRNLVNQVVVVMVPFPAQGHLNQLLQLSRLIAAYNIPVHYVGTATHNRQAKLRIHGWDHHYISNIHFHELPTPAFLSPPPNPDAPVKFPAHLQPSFNAMNDLRSPVAALLSALSAVNRRVVVVNDSMMGSVVQDFVHLPNAEAYTFHSISAFASFFFRWEKLGKPFPVDEQILKVLPGLDGCFTPEFAEFVRSQSVYTKHSSGRIYNSCIAIESRFLDLLSRTEISGTQREWALGPFNPVRLQSSLLKPGFSSSGINFSRRGKPHKHTCLEWLDKQGPQEVIYVSFGTTTSFSNQQIRELAVGLEKSQQKFIWVLRDADKGDVFAESPGRRMELPNGFEERMEKKRMGLVVRNWAPQMEILEHASTGGFMSHCGWNSCMESLTMGVPMAAWPMHSDQPRNAVLITQVLGVGVPVVKSAAANWPNDQLVCSSVIERAVRLLMAEEVGRQMRKRAADMGAAVRTSVVNGGSTKTEFDSFVTHITR